MSKVRCPKKPSCTNTANVTPSSWTISSMEDERLESSRAARSRDKENHTVVGLGFSGGGIRSATFNLGILQSMAKHEQLPAIDYLSTVSGGGYIGSFYTSLFVRESVHQSAAKPCLTEVTGILTGKTPCPQLNHLRHSGNYLAPAGATDYWLGLAMLLRNWISLLIVTGAFVLFLLSLVVAGHFAMRALPGLPCLHKAVGALNWMASFQLGTGWFWAAAAILLATCIPLGWAYWEVDDGERLVTRVKSPLLLGAGGLAGILTKPHLLWLIPPPLVKPATIIFSIMFALGALTILWLLLVEWKASRFPVDKGDHAWRRNAVTRWLAVSLRLSLVLAGVATLVHGGRILGPVLLEHGISGWYAALLAALATPVALAHRITLFLSARTSSKTGRKFPLDVVLTLAGFALIALVLLLGISILFAFCLRLDQIGLNIWPPLLLVAAASGCVATWLGREKAFLNNSTLQPFYASRLARAYLGATNPNRLRSSNILLQASEPKDDIPFDVYWPHDNEAARKLYGTGVPLHLVNVAINETVDGRTGETCPLRRGVPMAIGPAGFSVGVRHHLARTSVGCNVPVHFAANQTGSTGHSVFRPKCGVCLNPEEMSVGKWIATSGAAFSTGMGSKTNLGKSLICGLFNIRLGYWWRSGGTAYRTGRFGETCSRLATAVFPVQINLLREWFALFKGTADTHWNLSDGGHVENLGGYELIRRQLPVIILSDAEADPDYTFEGLANLVRLARTDFGAEINFLDEPGLANEGLAGLKEIGTLDDLRRGQAEPGKPIPPGGEDRRDRSRAHAAVARITYHEKRLENGPTEGWLLYVKPTLRGDEPVDLREYHANHPDFPHQSTADQFFDDAQWESHRKLGEVIGDRILRLEIVKRLLTIGQWKTN